MYIVFVLRFKYGSEPCVTLLHNLWNVEPSDSVPTLIGIRDSNGEGIYLGFTLYTHLSMARLMVLDVCSTIVTIHIGNIQQTSSLNHFVTTMLCVFWWYLNWYICVGFVVMLPVLPQFEAPFSLKQTRVYLIEWNFLQKEQYSLFFFSPLFKLFH